MSKNIKNEIKAFLAEEEGVGVIEIVLILVVLIGLVIVFNTRKIIITANAGLPHPTHKRLLCAS